jgi:hypothetical protein
MSLEIYQNNCLLYSGKDFPEGQMRVDIPVEWPGTLTIITGNKTHNDMLIENGFIVKQKYIEVIGLLINNFPLHIDQLDCVFDCCREDRSEITHENFWGFNGVITINFDAKNPMRYLLALNSEFDINRLTWNHNE